MTETTVAWESATYTLTTNNKHQCLDLILAAVSILTYICCLWFERFGYLYFMYCAWAGFGGGKPQDNKLHMYYFSCAIACALLFASYRHHVIWYLHKSLACYLWVSLPAYVCKYKVKIDCTVYHCLIKKFSAVM